MSRSPITEISRRVRQLRALQPRRKAVAQREVSPPAKTWKYLNYQDLKGLRHLLFAARTIVEGQYAGRHKSPFRGAAPEFVDYREYSPGDELRTLDWKAFARTDRYFVKLFEKETDMNCYILLDTSGSMSYGGGPTRTVLPEAGLSKLEYACYLGAALTYLMVKQGDKVGMTLFDEDINAHVPPGGTFGHLYTIVSKLERARPGRNTAVSEVLRKCFGLYSRRGLLIIISDMLDEPEAIFKALSMYTHRGFEIIIFHVFHRYEHRLPPLANANFIDAETSELLTCLPADIEQSYNAKIDDYIQTYRSLSRARGIDYNFINTETPYSAALEKYLLRRRSLWRWENRD